MTQENNRQLLKFYLEGGFLDQRPVKPQPEKAEELQRHMAEKDLLIESYRVIDPETNKDSLPLKFKLREAKEKEKSKKSE